MASFRMLPASPRTFRIAALAIGCALAAFALGPMTMSDAQSARPGNGSAKSGGSQSGSGITVPNPVPTSQASLTPSDTPLPTFTFTPVGSGTPTPCTVLFEDVPPSHPDYTAIRYMICAGVMEGFRCGQPGESCVPPDNFPYFRPNNLLARAEVMKYLVLAEGWVLTCSAAHFSDVPPSNPFFCFIETAFAHGVISGYNDGTFRPRLAISRAQSSKVIVLAQGWPINTAGGPHFTDVPTNHPFYPYIETAYNHDTIEGYCDWTFLPDNPLSRADLARYVYRAVMQPLEKAAPSRVGPAVLTCAPILTATPTPTGSPLAVTPTSTPVTTQTATGVPATRTPTPTAVATGTSTPECRMTFTDVSPSDYFYEAVRYLYCHNDISGYADGTFRPYNNTTRGQLSKIVVLAQGWSIDTGGGPHFTDVPVTNPFYNYIETAYNHEVISGYSDGTFRWGNNVTRGQLSKIIVSAEGWAIDTTGGPHFTDVLLTDPFYGYIETAYNHSIISGYADGTFRPGNNATRGQISKITYNAITLP